MAEENEIERSLWTAPKWVSVEHHFSQDSDKVKIMIKYGDSIYKEKKKFIQRTQYYLDKKVKYVDKMSFTNFILYHLDGAIVG